MKIRKSENDKLTQVDIGSVTLWFSYETVVAFETPTTRGLVVAANHWSSTTGRHLNAIDGGGPRAKERRLGADEFELMIDGVQRQIERAVAHA